MRWDVVVPRLSMRGDVPSPRLDGEVRRLALRLGERASVPLPEPPPEPEYFYGISGGLARYDARTLEMAEGDPVLAWPDASGQTDPLPALEGGAWMQPPVYSTANPPGVYYGYYTGDRSGHSIPAELARNPRVGFSFVVLVDRVLDGGIRGLVTWGDFRAADTGRWGVSTFNSNSLRAYASGTLQSDTGVWTPGPAVVAWSSDMLGRRVYVDDVLVASGPHSANFVPRLDEPGAIGDNLGGIVHDILFFDRALSPAELATVSAGLADDWNI